MKEAFQRRCMACNSTKNKYELIRVVKTQDGEIHIDKTGKMNGRGSYICNDINCLEKVMKTNRIERILKSNINKKIYEDIRGVIIDSENKKKNNPNN